MLSTRKTRRTRNVIVSVGEGQTQGSGCRHEAGASIKIPLLMLGDQGSDKYDEEVLELNAERDATRARNTEGKRKGLRHLPTGNYLECL